MPKYDLVQRAEAAPNMVHPVAMGTAVTSGCRDSSGAHRIRWE